MIVKSFEIQKNISNFIKLKFLMLYGENEGLKKEIKNNISSLIKKKEEKTEIVSSYESDIIENIDNFFNSIFSGSLFSNQKIIIINNATDKLNSQIDWLLEKKPENIIFIFISNILEKKSKIRASFEKSKTTACVPCYPDTEKDLMIITNNLLKKNNLIMSRESINLLVEKSNNDRNNLINEIEKIQAFALNKKTLSTENLKSLINFSGEHKSDELVNECLSGNIFQYKKILSDLYVDVVNHIFLLRILSLKIQRLLKMKEAEKDHDNLEILINSAKPPIFWKEKPTIKKQLLIWNLNELKKIINEIDKTELQCKKNPQNSNIIFFNFFDNICKKASNFS